jgi:hypothetical protein
MVTLKKRKKIKVPFTVVVRNVWRGSPPAAVGPAESSNVSSLPLGDLPAAAPKKKKKKKAAGIPQNVLIVGGVIVGVVVVIAMLKKPRQNYLQAVTGAGANLVDKVRGK